MADKLDGIQDIIQRAHGTTRTPLHQFAFKTAYGHRQYLKFFQESERDPFYFGLLLAYKSVLADTVQMARDLMCWPSVRDEMRDASKRFTANRRFYEPPPLPPAI